MSLLVCVVLHKYSFDHAADTKLDCKSNLKGTKPMFDHMRKWETAARQAEEKRGLEQEFFMCKYL